MSSVVPEVSAQEAADAAAADSVLLLDVREHDEWAARHAPTALHVPLSQLDVTSVPADRPVVAVCRSGNRSAKAAAALAQAGVDVVNIAGGMTAWAAAGLAVGAGDGGPGEIA